MYIIIAVNIWMVAKSVVSAWGEKECEKCSKISWGMTAHDYVRNDCAW